MTIIGKIFKSKAFKALLKYGLTALLGALAGCSYIVARDGSHVDVSQKIRDMSARVDSLVPDVGNEIAL